MAPPTPPTYPLVFPQNRSRITQEPAPGRNPGDPTKPLDADWGAHQSRTGGGGPFPQLFWKSNPKQKSDERSAG